MVIGRCTTAINNAIRNFSYYKTVEFVCATCVHYYNTHSACFTVYNIIIIIIIQTRDDKNKRISFLMSHICTIRRFLKLFENKMLKKINYIQGWVNFLLFFRYFEYRIVQYRVYILNQNLLWVEPKLSV